MASVIAGYLTHIGSRWEMQPDKREIHMAYPSKTVSVIRAIFPEYLI